MPKSLSLLPNNSQKPVVGDIEVQKQKPKIYVLEQAEDQKYQESESRSTGRARQESVKNKGSLNISQIAGLQRISTGKWNNDLTAIQVHRLRCVCVCVCVYTGMSNKLEESWEVRADYT